MPLPYGPGRVVWSLWVKDGPNRVYATRKACMETAELMSMSERIVRVYRHDLSDPNNPRSLGHWAGGEWRPPTALSLLR